MPSQIAEPWRQFTDELGFTPALDGPYDTLMQGWKSIMGKLVARYTFPAPDLTVHTQDVSVDGVRVRIYTPPSSETEMQTDTDGDNPNPDLPVALYFHAGGWIMGGVDEEDGFVRALCKLTHSRILSVDYRLAPAHPFPAPLDDCDAAARWALATFPTQHRLTLIGASAGGNMALATALSLIESEDENANANDGEATLGSRSRVNGVVALAPVTIHPDAVPAHLREQYTSYAENDRATINTQSAMRTFFDCYGAPPADPRVSVLLHPRLSALRGRGCRVYLAVGGADTLRDDVRLLAGRLREQEDNAGDGGVDVAVQVDEYPGFPHFSWLFPARVLGGHQREFMGNLVRGIKWVQSS